MMAPNPHRKPKGGTLNVTVLDAKGNTVIKSRAIIIINFDAYALKSSLISKENNFRVGGTNLNLTLQ
ncbi:MAG: hypothetical protein QXQ05_06770 [Candidatus Jordarchaeales archaeon]